MDGVVPLSNFSDTAGAFGRDPRSFAAFLQAWSFGCCPPYLRPS